MKILILANHHIGLYRFRKELINELLKDNQVIVALPYGENVEYFKKIGCDYIETRLERRGMNPFKDLRLLLKYCSVLIKEKPDLVITYTIKPNIYGGLACRFFRIQYDVNITGLGTAFQKNGLFNSLITFMYKLGLKKAKTVFFENIENKQLFIGKKVIKPDQACLLNGAGVNLDYFNVQDYPIDSETTKFLYIGRVMREKGIDELFEAMQLLLKNSVNCMLNIVGECEEDYSKQILKYESEGWLNYQGLQNDVRPFIKEADCIVLPSWHEGMANTNLEASAMGRPIITSSIHGCLEAVEDGVSGFLCEKKSSESLYSAMKKFIDLPYEKRKELGLAGRRHMEKNFDKNIIVEKTVSRL